MLMHIVDCLEDEYPMNEKSTNEGGYEGSNLRKILNTDIIGRFPDKITQKIVADKNGDLLFLLSIEEVCGLNNEFEEAGGQLDIYKTPKSRVKTLGKGGWPTWYWLRSPYGSGATYFCFVSRNSDFPFDYSNPLSSQMVENPGFTGSDFRMVIYGECEDPHIGIGEHLYEVDCTIGPHEYLTIDSKKKTIILTKQNGTTENKFRYRNRESYIFEKIPSGETLVSWDGDYKYDIILYEERSEPKWI